MMVRRRFYATGVWVDRHMEPWFTVIMIMVEVGLGTVILVGGIERFTLPSYGPLINLVGGRVWIWSCWILAAALLSAVPFRWLNIVGLWLGTVWNIIWMSCFTVAMLHYPNAAATPVVAYGGLAMFSAALLTARLIDKSTDE